MAGTLAALAKVDRKSLADFIAQTPDAAREVEEMAEKRLPSQYVIAAVDGIGWNRVKDLRRIHDLFETKQIDELYTITALGAFRTDLEAAAKRLGLLP